MVLPQLRRRVIIPSFDSEGFLNYFTARAIDESTRKYVNPKVKRTDIIFNELNVDWKKELVIVEGPFDSNYSLALFNIFVDSNILSIKFL